MEYINGIELQFDNDQIAIVNGDPFTGLACYYRDDGTLESEVDYVQGIQEGVIRDFDELGNVISESEVKNGAYHGQVTCFSPDGDIIKREKYEYGICIMREEIDSAGCAHKVFELKEGDPNYKILESMRSASE